VTKRPFARALVRKSARALKVARLALNAGDNDSAVSRSYYAMFDIARAALLRAGVTEDKLPRTHSGVIEAFRSHAVQSGQIDRQLATQLSRTESLRIKADYTGTEIELTEAPRKIKVVQLTTMSMSRMCGARYWLRPCLAGASLVHRKQRMRGLAWDEKPLASDLPYLSFESFFLGEGLREELGDQGGSTTSASPVLSGGSTLSVARVLVQTALPRESCSTLPLGPFC
jgi:uncharacterized protein (UPF0332 family)